jgi:hypothetical protein
MIDWSLYLGVMDADCGRHGVVVDEVDPLVHGAKARRTTQHTTRCGHTFEK